jgi:hypothetical protein
VDKTYIKPRGLGIEAENGEHHSAESEEGHSNRRTDAGGIGVQRLEGFSLKRVNNDFIVWCTGEADGWVTKKSRVRNRDYPLNVTCVKRNRLNVRRGVLKLALATEVGTL